MSWNWQSICGLSLSLMILQGCGVEGSKENGMAQIGVKFPKYIAPKSIPKSAQSSRDSLLPAAFQATQEQILATDIWISNFEPTVTSDLNCFGVLVSASDITNLTGSDGTVEGCFENESGTELNFGVRAMGASLGSTLSVEVASGTNRRIVILGWKSNSTEACNSLVEGTAVDVLNLSHPYLIGDQTIANLESGSVQLDVSASFTGAKRLVGCNFFVSNGAQAILTAAVSGTVSGLLGSGGTEGVELKITTDQGEQTLEVAADGAFVFPDLLNEGTAFTVTVSRHPDSVSCLVNNGSGTVSGTLPEVEVICSDDTFTLDGSAEGIIGRPENKLIIEVIHFRNGAEIARGTFDIDGNGRSDEDSEDEGSDDEDSEDNPDEILLNAFRSGDSFSIAIIQQPTLHQCTVINATGTFTNFNINPDRPDLAPRFVCVPTGFSVGGTVSGLNGSESSDVLVLKRSIEFGIDNSCGSGSECEFDDDDPNIAFVEEDGSFIFPGLQETGEGYQVVVEHDPFDLECTVTNGSGVVGNQNVDDISVTCEPAFRIGGSISGLEGGNTVVLSNNGESVVNSGNGEFSFFDRLTAGESYNVTVLSAPPDVECSVSEGSGTVSDGDVGNIFVSCGSAEFSVGGSISGLSGSDTVTLASHEGRDAPTVVSGNGAFSFSEPFSNGDGYGVLVISAPEGFNCSVSNGSGTVFGDVTDIFISCAPAQFVVGGTISGLGSGKSLRISNNETDFLTVTSNGVYTMPTLLNDGEIYDLFADTDPEEQICTPTNESGTISGSDVTNIDFVCVDTFVVGGTIDNSGSSVEVLVTNTVTGDSILVSAGGVESGFEFDTRQADGASYFIDAAPGNSENVNCLLDNESGTIAGADVTNISVTCSEGGF